MKQQKFKKIISYDPKGDVLYIGLQEGFEEEYIEIAPGIGAELDENGKIIGIEILNASEILKPASRAIEQKRVFRHAFA